MDLNGIICKSQREYQDKIKKNIDNIISKKRSILLICYSIHVKVSFLTLNQRIEDKIMEELEEKDKKVHIF